MRNVVLALGILLSASSFAKTAPANVKATVKKELAGSGNGWLPDPQKAGFKPIQTSDLKGRIATEAKKLGVSSDGQTVYQGKIGRTHVFVIDTQLEGATFRSVLSGSGKDLTK